MGYRNKTYVVFDGDEDKWAYGFMLGWKKNEHVDFDFHDAHEIFKLTANAQDEDYIKRALKERFKSAKQVIVLVGEGTKHLYKYVRWELEVAIGLDLPIIAVNIADVKKRRMDQEHCPPIIRDRYVMHVSFNAAIIKYAMDNFAEKYAENKKTKTGPYYYTDEVYEKLGL
ncbi:MAG: TIR domain-containing protein [Acidobacteria bacterium]|nr:TIR domain-containing protein [Acidobacteriota bacterium]